LGNESHRLDAAYIEQKRRQLSKLRDELRSSGGVAESDEVNSNSQLAQQAREYEDDAQKLDTLEREGSYGLSDVSGHSIPKERLDAIPEAINTLSEQQAGEGRG
jgi:DnaK suppressor protein